MTSAERNIIEYDILICKKRIQERFIKLEIFENSLGNILKDMRKIRRELLDLFKEFENLKETHDKS